MNQLVIHPLTLCHLRLQRLLFDSIANFHILLWHLIEPSNSFTTCNHLLFRNLYHIFVLQVMSQATPLREMLCTPAPHQRIIKLFGKRSMNVVAKMLNSCAASVLR